MLGLTVAMILVTGVSLALLLFVIARLFCELVTGKESSSQSYKRNLVMWFGVLFLNSTVFLVLFYITAIIVLMCSNEVVPQPS
jgi:hypothetical protein